MAGLGKNIFRQIFQVTGEIRLNVDVDIYHVLGRKNGAGEFKFGECPWGTVLFNRLVEQAWNLLILRLGSTLFWAPLAVRLAYFRIS